MTITLLRAVFGWCSIINISLLAFSFLMIKFARDMVFRLHGQWFNLSPEKLDELLYGMMGFYKIIIIFFNVVPYFALGLVG